MVVEHLNWAELAPEQPDEIGDCSSIRGIGGMCDTGSAFRNDQLFGLLDNLSANIDDHDDSARTRERNRSRPPDARILAHPAAPIANTVVPAKRPRMGVFSRASHA